ncbi:MAG: mercury(II) reductase [Candidatus Paceibacterota bacterium]
MKNTHYDFIIVGGGAAASAAAIKAHEQKKKTALINSGLPIGGTCVNVGCLPSKTLLFAAETMHHAKHHGIPGIDSGVNSFDFKRVIEDELALVEFMRENKYRKTLEDMPLLDLIEGSARFVSENEIEVHPSTGSGQAGEILSADKFLIATGSKANVPPIKGIEETGYLTHIEALQIKELPKEMVIVGAGPVGLEFAQMYARFGTKVTLLQRESVILPHAEQELVLQLKASLEKEGIAIALDANVEGAHKEGERKVVTYSQGGETKEVVCDQILLAAGKTPNTRELNLESAGVATNEQHAVVVSPTLQTSQAHIFAAGDVVALPRRLETTAGREGTIAAENALRLADARSGQALKSIDYNTVPYAIFTDPQLASVGYTEEAQTNELGVCACRTVSFEQVPKAKIMRRTEGMIKMGIHPKTGVIMGVHILGPNAADLISEAMVLVKNKNTIDDVVNSLPMFPTLSEAMKYVALSFTKDINKLSCCI